MAAIPATLRAVQRDLDALGDPTRRDGALAFFKEPVRTRGIQAPVLRSLARGWYTRLKAAGWTGDDIAELGHALLETDWLDEGGFANELHKKLLTARYFHQDPRGAWRHFERWLPCYRNWAVCDIHCTSIVGVFLEDHPEFLPRLERWATHKSRWYRRAATVTLVMPAQHGKYLDEAYARAADAMRHGDDLLDKAAGWVLRSAGGRPRDADYRARQARLLAFLQKHIQTIPRVTLSYATEHMAKIPRAALYAIPVEKRPRRRGERPWS
jgi:3-methyladenine DNA glycosylase AlkD